MNSWALEAARDWHRLGIPSPHLRVQGCGCLDPVAAFIETLVRPVSRDFDTVIVPAREEGFRRVFLGEGRWYPIRLSPETRKRLKYLAVYRTAPISAVTHIADVQGLRPLEDGRWAIDLERVREVDPIRFIKDGTTKTLQTPRLARLSTLLAAGSLNQILRA